jgi:hypothetical protein
LVDVDIEVVVVEAKLLARSPATSRWSSTSRAVGAYTGIPPNFRGAIPVRQCQRMVLLQ